MSLIKSECRERERGGRIEKKGVCFGSLSRCEYTLTREYNWNVKNKASKGYEVCADFPQSDTLSPIMVRGLLPLLL